MQPKVDILEIIVIEKRKEVAAAKAITSIEALRAMPFFNRKCNALSERLKTHNGVIAEHKRKSPSKGLINGHSPLEEVVLGYKKAGVSGISVLTDEPFFGGNLSDLVLARKTVPHMPLLRKDFIIDAYQIYEAKAHGADLILLIARILTQEEVLEFTLLAQELGMEVLFEIHDEEEILKANDHINHIGVNNRNLKTFEVDLKFSEKILPKLDSSSFKIAESGISDVATINALSKIGIDGFLIGENFMREEHPGLACISFCEGIKKKST